MTMLMSTCLIVPIGPIISLLKTWFGSARHKLLKAKAELTYPEEEPKLFEFKDAERLPFPENEAIASARIKITEGEFEQAIAVKGFPIDRYLPSIIKHRWYSMCLK